MVTTIKPNLFISYAHADGQSLVKEFWELLSDFLNSPTSDPTRVWDKWDDKKISVGQEWDKTICQALENSCNCCLLLVSDLFGKSSYIADKEWPKTLQRYQEAGIVFFPVAFGVMEDDLAGLPKGIDIFQVYWPSVSDLYRVPPQNILYPDTVRLCYKDIKGEDALKDRFLSRLAKQMNNHFDEYLRVQAAKATAQTHPSHQSKSDLSQFITNASDENTLAKAMFGSFSYEKRYRDSSSKGHYFCREVDHQLDKLLNDKRWVIIEGHPLAGKTRAVFEAIKRLQNSGNSFAMWPFKMPEQASQPLLSPKFPEADYRIVWMDDFDALLRDIIKKGYSSNDINLLLKCVADNNLILIATARTGPTYFDIRNRFGLDDHLWDKLESLSMNRLSGNQEKAFFAWYKENIDENLSNQYDHHPGSLFLDLEAMRTRWLNMDNIVQEHDLKFNSEHAKDILKTLHIFYVMEAYRAGGIFLEKDIQFYLKQKFKHQESSSSIGKALSNAQWVNQPFADHKWETLIEFLSQDRFHLGFLRREGDYLVTETAYLDYIVALDGEKNIVNTLDKILSKEERLSLGLSITGYNFSEILLKKAPRNEEQLKNIILKLKPLGLEHEIYVWNQLIEICPTYSLARIALGILRSKLLKPNFLTYEKLLLKVNDVAPIRTITQEMLTDGIVPYSKAYERLLANAKNYQIAQELFEQINALGVKPTITVFFKLLSKSPNYEMGRLVLERIKAAGFVINTITFNCLLQKVTGYETARRVLVEMKTDGFIPNSVTYNYLLQQVTDYKTAHLVLDEMMAAGVMPNSSTYDHLLKKVTDYETGRLVLDEMRAAGVMPNSSTYNHLLQKVRDYETGRLVLDEMRTAGVMPNSSTYDHLLQKVRDYETGRLALDEMRTAGVMPNSSTYHHLLQKVRDYETGRLVLDEMRAAGVMPNSSTYNHLLQKVRDYETGRLVLDEMRAAGVMPNSSTYNHLLQKVRDYETGRLVLDEMRAAGVMPNSGNYNRLITIATDFEMARLILGEMKAAGVMPESSSYNCLLSRVADYQTARLILDEMQTTGIKPNLGTYNQLFLTIPDYETGIFVLDEMRGVGIKPDLVSYQHLLSNTNNHEKIQIVLEEINRVGFKLNVGIYNILIEKTTDYEAGCSLINEMQGLGLSPNVQTYKLLLEKTRDDEAIRAIFERMKATGIDPKEIDKELG